MKLIKLKEVSKRYGQAAVLENVNLTIEEEEILGIIGKSGSGKTTLLNLIAGFVEATQGDVVYISKITGEEKNLSRNLHRVKKHIGFMPQHNSFYPKLTVKENLLHFGRLYNIEKETLHNNIKNLLTFTELYEQKDKLAAELSGGMQKRLDISCSLVHKPKILILDEPTADLDPVFQKEILQMLQQVNKQGITVVVASHNLDGIESICHKIAIVHNARVHTYGSLEEVRKPYLRDNFTITVKTGQDKQELIKKLRVLPVKKIIERDGSLVLQPEDMETTMKKLLQIINEDNLYLHDVDVRKPTLTEIFEDITVQK
ncbi:ABC transporter ATP-binding protein [Candidatus Woesearchaeota archaeon]|nr:ABC transporter ATP-binding protein [Candidatus Woesearchaeota archaeon]